MIPSARDKSVLDKNPTPMVKGIMNALQQDTISSSTPCMKETSLCGIHLC